MKKIDIWTDGSCRINPGPGGYGVLIIEDNEIISAYNETCEKTTNNREEMKAIIYALRYATIYAHDAFYTIHSDSAYCVNMFNDWIKKWANKNWINTKGKEVENLDLVKIIYEYAKIDFPNFRVVKTHGHVGILENELADALATNNLKRFNKILEDNNELKVKEE